MKKILILLATGIFISGCAQNDKLENNVIVKINKTEITKEDFLKQLNSVPEWAKERFKDNEGKEKLLKEIIKKELLYQDAIRKRLHKNGEFLARVEEFKKMTLLSAVLKKEVEEKATVDAQDVKDFYNKNPDKFKKGASVRASHILVDTEKEAKDILAKVKKGESFYKLAVRLSKDKASAKKGGDLGFFGRGQMVPEFEQVAFSLKPGKVSKPVKTRFGYHIIKVLDKRESTLINFEQAKGSIKRQLLTEKQKKLFESYIENLKKRSEIMKNKDALAALQLPWKEVEKEKK